MNEEVSLEDILGTSDENSVRFYSAQDASVKIGQIADSIRISQHPEKLSFGLLYHCIEALQVS